MTEEAVAAQGLGMTRKDYEAVASALRNARRTGGDEDTLHRVAEELSEVFHAENPRFAKPTFLKACGVVPPSLSRPGLTAGSEPGIGSRVQL